MEEASRSSPAIPSEATALAVVRSRVSTSACAARSIQSDANSAHRARTASSASLRVQP